MFNPRNKDLDAARGIVAGVMASLALWCIATLVAIAFSVVH